MSSGADLFVVCKQCGSEVSPYITECPYCGGRLRRRAPKLPRVGDHDRPVSKRGTLSRLLRSSRPARAGAGARARSGSRRRAGASLPARWDATRPNATIALVALGALAWVARHAEPDFFLRSAILGPLRGDWWRLFSFSFAYVNGIYAFVALLTVALFGWLIEQRHGPFVVLALFFAAAVSGALVALAVYPIPVLTGANAAALGLLGAWAVPDLLAVRANAYYEGDLLGAAVLAVLLLAIPFAFVIPETSWLAGVTGLAVGALAGLGLARRQS